ncbi:MAG: DHH family phosphoesterase, partial [Clostridia bacterium]|nr:DHH family phosphoesterase [Clostridia bacterium]
FNSTHRVADMEELLLSNKAPRILFDHHLNPEIPADFVVSHPSLCSTSEIVFRVVWQLGGYEGMTSSGADSIRPITFRTQPSTGKWFLHADSWHGLLAGIRKPANENPWA